MTGPPTNSFRALRAGCLLRVRFRSFRLRRRRSGGYLLDGLAFHVIARVVLLAVTVAVTALGLRAGRSGAGGVTAVAVLTLAPFRVVRAAVPLRAVLTLAALHLAVPVFALDVLVVVLFLLDLGL